MTAVQSTPTPLLVQYEREEMTFEEDYVDVGELSDSPSSGPSLSRPHTPSSLNLSLSPSTSNSNTNAHTIPKPKPDQPLALAAKAERILGLIPGTLVHARAALENARDEIRRTADTSAPFGTYVSADSQTGLKGKMSRARKAMSVSLSHMPNVVVGLGGREEMVLRERRRRAVDGVLYWQKEVARLEAAEAPITTRGSRR